MRRPLGGAAGGAARDRRAGGCGNGGGGARAGGGKVARHAGADAGAGADIGSGNGSAVVVVAEAAAWGGALELRREMGAVMAAIMAEEKFLQAAARRRVLEKELATAVARQAAERRSKDSSGSGSTAEALRKLDRIMSAKLGGEAAEQEQRRQSGSAAVEGRPRRRPLRVRSGGPARRDATRR